MEYDDKTQFTDALSELAKADVEIKLKRMAYTMARYARELKLEGIDDERLIRELVLQLQSHMLMVGRYELGMKE